MRIHLSSLLIDEQDKALYFCTEVLGFEKKTDLPLASPSAISVRSSSVCGASASGSRRSR